MVHPLRDRVRLVLTGLILLVLVGCGPSLSDRTRSVVLTPEGPVYELAWVDPSIVFSDTLFTLIHADRIDSFLVESSVEAGNPDRETSLEFQVAYPTCFVSLSVFAEDGRMIRPLLARKLPRGYYKVTVNPEQFEEGPMPFLLKATYCDQEATVLLSPFIPPGD